MKQKIRIHGTEVEVVDGGDSDLDADVGGRVFVGLRGRATRSRSGLLRDDRAGPEAGGVYLGMTTCSDGGVP